MQLNPFNCFRRLSKPKALQQRTALVITPACIENLVQSVAPSRDRGHEGVAYLLGQTDGNVTLAVLAVAPKARTTRGSFEVGPLQMSRVVRTAANFSLKVVGQVHTHPGSAYHSEGDIEGARIRYDGYVSIVLPDFGRHIPRLEGAAVYHFRRDCGWRQLTETEFLVLPESLT